MQIILLLNVIAAFSVLPLLVNTQPFHEVGASTQYKTEDNFGNYAFGYNEGHTSGGSFRKEVGDSLGNKIGSYGLHDADGRARVVNYVADGAGFRADVHTNEPGVDPSQDPADVAVNKPAVAVVAPPSVVVAHHVAPAAISHHVAPAAISHHFAPAAISHHVAVAPAVVHKTVIGAPVMAFASHHHAISFLHAPVLHTPFVSAIVGHVPHVLF